MYRRVGCRRLVKAVEFALDFLGPSAKNALLYHLVNECGIRLEFETCSTLHELERALEDLMGKAAAQIIMKSIIEELDRGRPTQSCSRKSLP
jgi:hypothetical protein